ncbi:MAG: TM2 domain-containing protein [Flavobacteriaceae bacterium]|nr:TM2 domain-containing protein [Flavobacteriaceae bacterium]
MKIKLSIILVALFFITTNSFASFPVKRTTNKATTENNITENTSKEISVITDIELENNQYIAAGLALLLGTIGLHNFYLGHQKYALIQLAFAVLTLLTPIPFYLSIIWALVDFVRILIGDLQPKGGSYTS